MGAADRFADQVGDRQCFNLATSLGLRAKGNRIGDNQLLERAFLDALDRRAGQHRDGSSSR